MTNIRPKPKLFHVFEVLLFFKPPTQAGLCYVKKKNLTKNILWTYIFPRWPSVPEIVSVLTQSPEKSFRFTYNGNSYSVWSPHSVKNIWVNLKTNDFKPYNESKQRWILWRLSHRRNNNSEKIQCQNIKALNLSASYNFLFKTKYTDYGFVDKNWYLISNSCVP